MAQDLKDFRKEDFNWTGKAVVGMALLMIGGTIDSFGDKIMSKVLLALTSVALLGLSGCADTAKVADSKPAATATAAPAISPEAQAALTAAQADFKAAKAKNEAWTTADSAIKAAEEAAKKGDSATVLKQAKFSSEQSKLSLGQMNYPVLKASD